MEEAMDLMLDDELGTDQEIEEATIIEDGLPEEKVTEKEPEAEKSAGKTESVLETQTEVATQSTNTSVAQSYDFNFEGLSSIPGVIVGDMGMEIPRLPVEKVKFTKDSRALISLVSSQMIGIKTHYHEDLGTYLCFGGKCCEIDDIPRVKYLFPVVVYDTDKRGAPVSKKVQMKVLAVGKDAYEELLTIADLNGDLREIDLLVKCTEEQYQNISFNAAGAVRWKKSKAMTKEVIDFWNQNMKNIVLPVARKITEAQLLKVANATEEVRVETEVDFDDVFND